MIAVKNWVTQEVELPKISLRIFCVMIRENLPFLLHGPERTIMGKSSLGVIRKIVSDAGVEVVFGMTGVPSRVYRIRAQLRFMSTTDIPACSCAILYVH